MQPHSAERSAVQLLDWLIDRTHAISRFSMWTAGAFMIATVFMISAEILLRRMGSGLIAGASEVGGYMLAICTVWAFSFTLLQRANIRFDILYVRCGPRLRALLDLFGLLALGVFVFTVTYHGYAVLATSIGFNTRSISGLPVPTWLPQSLWFAGLAFLCWTILILSLRVCIALLQRDLNTVSRLAGSATATEEIKRETQSLPDGR
jgi:TRAP-type C4-dicarboxylate transport system permease small subunit